MEKFEFRCRRESRGNWFPDPPVYDAPAKMLFSTSAENRAQFIQSGGGEYSRELEPNGHLSGRMLRAAVSREWLSRVVILYFHGISCLLYLASILNIYGQC